MAKSNVAKRNAAMQKVYDDSRKIRAVYAGTDSMRKAGKTYLPKKEAESEEAYKVRLAQSELYNKLADTIHTTAGKLFADPVVPNEGFQEPEILNTIDSEGRDITRFGMDWLLDASQPGVSYALADYPTGETGLTREQEQAMGLRPYASIIKQENILSFDSEFVGANRVLTRVNIFEQVQEEGEDEFDEKFVDQIRVLRLRDGVMTFELWRKPEGKDWQIYQDETPTTMTAIPLVPLYTKRTGYMTGECPYEDIADLNITHWQSGSSQRHILDFVRFPVLFGKGLMLDSEGSVEYGANRLIMGNADENSDLKHVEHSGAGIEAGERDLESLEQQMDALSKQVLTRRTGNVTATARAIDESSSSTDIQALANIVENALNRLIEYMGMWAGKEYGTVSLSADFSLSAGGEKDIEALQFAVQSRFLSGQEYMAEMVRRGIKKEYDFEADQTFIETGLIE